MTRLRRMASALVAALTLGVVGLIITLDLMWRALAGQEEP